MKQKDIRITPWTISQLSFSLIFFFFFYNDGPEDKKFLFEPLWILM